MPKTLEEQCRERKLERETTRARLQIARHEERTRWRVDLADRRLAVEIVKLVFLEMDMGPGEFQRRHYMRLVHWKPAGEK